MTGTHKIELGVASGGTPTIEASLTSGGSKCFNKDYISSVL